MKKIWRWGIGCVLWLAVDLSVSAQSGIEVEENETTSSAVHLNDKQRIETLERQMQHQMDLLKQIDSFSQQIKGLQGQLEVQAHDLKRLEEQQKNQYSDLDQRLTQLPKEKSPKNEDVAPKTTSTDHKNSDTLTKADAAEKAYQTAYGLLKNKHYDKAKTAFQAFIHHYPNDVNRINAHYWLGNLYLLNNQAEKAIVEFKQVIKIDTAKTKTADTLLKLGLAYTMQGNTKQANTQFKKLKQNYPATAAAKACPKTS